MSATAHLPQIAKIASIPKTVAYETITATPSSPHLGAEIGNIDDSSEVRMQPANNSSTRARVRISPTTLALLVFAGGLFLGVVMLAPTRTPAAYQSHIAIKGKKQGQFVSPSGTKKPSTTGPAPTTPARGR